MSNSSEPSICEVGGKGLLMPFGGDDEQNLSNATRTVIYAVCLCWCFLGVSIIADIFMAGIEAITSKRKQHVLETGQMVTVRVWNTTVANLTLMALGSSAPEILLNVIEILSNDFFAGDLGPSTIVGSAAFNLLMIMAICVAVIPAGEARTIRQVEPFLVTAFFSVFAYIWLIFIIAIHTQDKVDVWEGVLTFLFFPILVVIAFLADTGKFNRSKQNRLKEEEENVQAKMNEAGMQISADDAKLLVQAKEEKENDLKSRAARRAEQVGTKVITPKELSVGFLSKKYCFHEDTSQLMLEVEKIGELAMEMRVGVEFRTRDGNMLCSVGHYKSVTDCLEIPAGQRYAQAVITRENAPKLESFLHDLAPARDENKELLGPGEEGSVDAFFNLELTSAFKLPTKMAYENFIDKNTDPEKSGDSSALEQEMAGAHPRVNIVPEFRKAQVAITSIKDVGRLRFDAAQFCVPGPPEDTETVVTVKRFNGSEGELRCLYRCEADSAKPGYDYDHTEGELVFGPGVTSQEIRIKIHKKNAWESSDRFFVLLSNAEGSAPALEDESHAITGVVISCEKAKGVANQMLRFVDKQINLDAFQEGNSAWRDQWIAALRPNSGDEDDLQTASAIDWTIHIIALPWKVLFACVPPMMYCGGWGCFIVALIFIGGVTALIGDLAGLLGCVMGLNSGITAITIVAVGTSLPDAFASKTAAIDDPSADNAIGNVTGSNSVNVFLGIGLPWMVAAIYWEVNDPTSKWREKYPNQISPYPGGGFIVEAGDLAFSVITFTLAALSALALIWYRRKALQAELGGPEGAKTNTCIFLVLLWFFYIGLAIWKIESGDQSTGIQILALAIGVCCVGVGMVVLNGVIYVFNAVRNKNNEDIKKILVQHNTLQMSGAQGAAFGSLDLQDCSGPEVVSKLKDHIAGLTALTRALESGMITGLGNTAISRLCVPKEKLDTPSEALSVSSCQEAEQSQLLGNEMDSVALGTKSEKPRTRSNKSSASYHDGAKPKKKLAKKATNTASQQNPTME